MCIYSYLNYEQKMFSPRRMGIEIHEKMPYSVLVLIYTRKALILSVCASLSFPLHQENSKYGKQHSFKAIFSLRIRGNGNCRGLNLQKSNTNSGIRNSIKLPVIAVWALCAFPIIHNCMVLSRIQAVPFRCIISFCRGKTLHRCH